MTRTRILILGADGFIGRHIAVHLRNQQLDILCAVRNPAHLKAMGFATVRLDLSNPEQVQQPLKGIDVILNCAGLLNGSSMAMQHVHVTGPEQVYRAGKIAGVQKIILISAVGIDADTGFGRYKTMGEETLKASHMPYIILRPSMVLAETSYGGSSLMRGLAMMPFVTPVVGDGDQTFDPVHADDLAKTVHLAILSDQLDNQTLPVCGPERITQLDMVRAYRGWLGQPDRRVLKIPVKLARGFGRLGDWLKLGPNSRYAPDGHSGPMACPALPC